MSGPDCLIQGNADQAGAYDFTGVFVEKLRAAKVPCELITLTNASHRIAEWDKFDSAWQTKLVAWLKENLPAN
jgi:dipeptidyl aminopeptidase/acylaminoacyl peptidase